MTGGFLTRRRLGLVGYGRGLYLGISYSYHQHQLRRRANPTVRGTMFRVRVRSRSAAMHLMVRNVGGMSCLLPGLETDAIAILVTCKLYGLVHFVRWTGSPQVLIHDTLLTVKKV